MNTTVDPSDTTQVTETQVINLEGLHIPPDSPMPDGVTAHDVLRDARRFHFGDPSTESAVNAELLPALMHSLRKPELIRTDYPLVLLQDGKAVPLFSYFKELVNQIGETKILTDNLVRVEKQVRDTLVTAGDAAAVIGDAGALVADALNLNDEADKVFREKGAELVKAIPAGTTLVPCNQVAGPTVALHIIEAKTKSNTLRSDAVSVRDALLSMNSKEKSVEAPGLDQSKLQAILNKTLSGSVSLDDARVARIDSAIETINYWLENEDDTPLYIVKSEDVTDLIEPHGSVVVKAGGDLCKVACDTFEDIAKRYAPLFGALRTARLELANAFESPRHNHLLDTFTRHNFSETELSLLPTVVGVGTVTDGMSNLESLSAILRSTRPVTLLLIGDDLASLDHERIELAYLAVAHRKTFASQVSIAHPSHMIDSFVAGMSSTRPTLHTIASEVTHPLGAWLEGNAAIESRACPLLRYDPSKGRSWAERFDLLDNPQPEHDWPICHGTVGELDLTLSFTFAHCALLNPDMHKYFSLLPDGLDSNDLMPIEEWLHLSTEESIHAIPYLWAADIDGAIHRVVVARAVTDVCKERLDYWNTLRELAGIENEHVRLALENERVSFSSQLDTLQETLTTEHTAEIESIRTTASQVAMQQLAQVLLSGGAVMPMASVPTMQAAPPPAVPSTNGAIPSDTASAEPADAAAEEPESEDLGEPWIDSPICTTCNDCMSINAQVFAYNDDKQAYIKDATAGTFDEIVRAAEICPARCIHPGSPLSASETGLPELIQRAAEFN
ncbi:ferredoxin [PVC group bacterium]|nr:ferredoxin [PVC group bacterium]